MSDLDIFFPAPRQVPLRDLTLALLPLRVGVTPAFLKAIAPAMALLQVGAFQLAVMEQKDAMRAAIVIATGLTEAEVDNLYNDEFFQVLLAVVEVNLGFFVQRVVPQLTRLIDLVVLPKPAPVADGPSPSPDLSAPATA